jgi:hypothetical protein
VIERQVIDAYRDEVERSKQPGYVPPSLDAEDMDLYDDTRFNRAAPAPGTMRLRPTGTLH